MKAKISLMFLLSLLLLTITPQQVYAQSAGGHIKMEKCPTCGKLKQNCPYKGKHPKKLTPQKASAAIDFKAKILCNGIEDKFENNRFKNGDDFYLSFQSPVNGYLAVYLEGEDDLVSCLLPYHNQKNGIYPIEANHRYLFFDPGSAPINEKALVVEYRMTCNNKSEHNQIYIIFSPNKFTKASDYVVQEGLPRQIPRKDFQAWLSMCRKRDNEMNVRKVKIMIEQ